MPSRVAVFGSLITLLLLRSAPCIRPASDPVHRRRPRRCARPWGLCKAVRRPRIPERRRQFGVLHAFQPPAVLELRVLRDVLRRADDAPEKAPGLAALIHLPLALR